VRTRKTDRQDAQHGKEINAKEEDWTNFDFFQPKSRLYEPEDYKLGDFVIRVLSALSQRELARLAGIKRDTLRSTLRGESITKTIHDKLREFAQQKPQTLVCCGIYMTHGNEKKRMTCKKSPPGPNPMRGETDSVPSSSTML
jgi:hypothetical protein